jgi:XTP/dITP diphosphohydrolase
MKRFLSVVTLSLVASLFAFTQFGCAGPPPTVSTNTNMAIPAPTPDKATIETEIAKIENDWPRIQKKFETNAAIKARFGVRASGLPTLADDSGIEVDALASGPGVRTRRYAGENATDLENNAKLLRALGDLPPERRGARYVCVLALALPDDAGPRGGVPLIIARGTCRGRIATEPRGTGGFGYDPIFEPGSEPPGGRTLGLWTPVEKHAISHRARAARRMIPRLAVHGFR